MADPKKAFEILARYYATVTSEEFLEDVRRALPKKASRFDEWICSKNAMESGVNSGTPDVVTNSAIVDTK